MTCGKRNTLTIFAAFAVLLVAPLTHAVTATEPVKSKAQATSAAQRKATVPAKPPPQSVTDKSVSDKAVSNKSVDNKSAGSSSARTSTSSRARSPARPEIKSSSALVVAEDDSAVLLSKKADVVAPIASITKLMTALVVLEAKQPLDEPIKITREDRATERGASSRLAIGTTLSRGDLLHLALMSSENRAAHAVGRNYPGGMSALLRAMNAKAKALGMKRARFVDPTGLSDGNVATPADLSKLVIAASRNATIREFSTDSKYAVQAGRSILEFRNTNTLVLNSDWDISVQKTGYTSTAGQCLVMKTVIDNRSVVIVLLNSFGKYTRTADARRIRKWMEAGSRDQQLARSH